MDGGRITDLTHCTLCPRACGADRTRRAGACGADAAVRIAKVLLHRYEEPCLSGTRGSGAVFFYGCNLGCGYCQNGCISHGDFSSAGGIAKGDDGTERLRRAVTDLQAAGAHNIDLITGAPYVPLLAAVLRAVKPHLTVPVVYNSSGYERVEALRLLDGLVDVYLPDYKYDDGAAAARYSHAPDYPAVAQAAIAEMVRQVGAPRFDAHGLLTGGVVVRHLVLPSLRRDGIAAMRRIAALFPQVYVSVMRQYTPDFNRTGDRSFDRRVTTFEYRSVLDEARRLGLRGWCQQKDSADARYTPDFSRADGLDDGTDSGTQVPID